MPVAPAVEFSEDLFAEILRQHADGKTVRSICRQDGMPAFQRFYEWLDADETRAGRFARARLSACDAIADECKDIADTPQEGIIEKLELVKINDPDNPDAPPTTELQVTERRREDMLGHRKLQIETRLKLLSKWDTARYGDKTAVNLSGKLSWEQAVLGSLTPVP